MTIGTGSKVLQRAYKRGYTSRYSGFIGLQWAGDCNRVDHGGME